MSLLMDALKKAERARAARRDGETDEPDAQPPLSLDPIDAAAERELRAPDEPASPPFGPRPGAPSPTPRAAVPAPGDFALERADDDSLDSSG